MQLLRHVFIMAVDLFEDKDHDGDENQNNPGAVKKFRFGDDQNDDTGDDCAETVDERPGMPMAALFAPPVHHQTGLGDREG